MREKYFEQNGSQFAFLPDLRRRVIFGRHDLTRDAPISRLDLLVCRNTLMYFNVETQSQVIDRFHFALREGGCLFLGKAEMLLSDGERFEVVSMRQRYFRRRPGAAVPRYQSLPAKLDVVGTPEMREVSKKRQLRDLALETAPFAVIGIEKGLALDVHGLTISLRLDRVDALDGGGVAIVDYKTGLTSSPEVWFEPRPRAPQLGLYALAQRAATPGERVRAVAYTQLKAGELAVRGLAADDGAWPGLPLPAGLRRTAIADWNAALTYWANALDALGTEIVAGLATVTPRDPRMTCKHCGLQPFCRIGAVALRAGERDDSDDDDDD